MAERFEPKRYVVAPLATSAIVKLYTDGRSFGLELTNSQGERTRALLSDEAVAAISTGYHALSAGGGEKVEYGWVEVKPHALVREDTPNA